MAQKGTIRELQEDLKISRQTVKGLSEYCDKYKKRIEELEQKVKKLNIVDVSKRVLKRICSGERCNKEFDVELSIYADKTKAISSIQMCPHCGGRNDIWIEMT